MHETGTAPNGQRPSSACLGKDGVQKRLPSRVGLLGSDFMGGDGLPLGFCLQAASHRLRPSDSCFEVIVKQLLSRICGS